MARRDLPDPPAGILDDTFPSRYRVTVWTYSDQGGWVWGWREYAHTPDQLDGILKALRADARHLAWRADERGWQAGSVHGWPDD